MWLVYRRIRPSSPAPRPKVAAVTRRRGTGLAPRPCLSPFAAADTGGWEFEFLNVRRRLCRGGFDWHPEDVPRLWRYNLHYFEYLLDDAIPIDSRDLLIDDWISSNPAGTADAWEAYPASLRIVNWIDYFLQTEASRPLQPAWLDSLYAQTLWLERNVEHHILANHLLKNIVALVFSAAFFSGADADRWRRKGERMLLAELKEQFLDDGGHFERSPMYHAIAAQDLVDVVNLWRKSKAPSPTSLDAVTQTAVRALRFLADVTHPDGGIALFNDAAHGVALRPDALLDYAAGVLGAAGAASAPQHGVALISRPSTGYYGFRSNGDYLLADCGAIGPDYQPGHAHCDLLSLELSLDGRRLIVDTGVSGYDEDPSRHYVRSTAAHNTVRVAGAEQSEVWGTFRVGRRATPLSGRINTGLNGEITVSGAHDGYRHLPQRVVHFRELMWGPGERTLRIEDRFDGRGTVRIESFLHLAPDVTISGAGHDFELRRLGERIARLCVVDHIDVDLHSGDYCPEFGKRLSAPLLVMSKEAALPFGLGFKIVA